MDQFSTLNAFYRAVEAGGFPSAATELNVFHTVMSKQVRRLETLLDAQLLNRTTRKLALTEAGQTCYNVRAVFPTLCRHLSPKVRAFIDFASEIYCTPSWA